MNNLTQEQKIELLQDYNNRENTVRALEEKWGISRTAICRIAVELGAVPRRPSAFGKTRELPSRKATCPKCRKRIEVKGARFCPYCGSDIRSEKDKLRERLEKVISCVELLPCNIQDEVRDTLLDTIKELKK